MLQHSIQRGLWAAEREVGRWSRGVNIGSDIYWNLKNLEIRTIFDVGAHYGETAKKLARWFPHGRIFCFEPASTSYAMLTRHAVRLPTVECYRLALGNSEGTTTLIVRADGVNNSLAAYDPACGAEEVVGEEYVQIETVGAFCDRRGIGHIDYLKVDTEGGDMDVLRGANHMLHVQDIGLVEVEAGLNSGNKKHVPLEDFKVFFEPLGYWLFGVYEQIPEWQTGRPYLRRCNAVFVADSVAGDVSETRRIGTLHRIKRVILSAVDLE
jgi:FkbM family methyltransferase